MLQAHITLLVLIGFPMMLFALYTRSDDFVIIAGLVGTFAFGLVTFGLFNVEVVSNGSVVTVGQYPPIALFTLALTLISFYPALTGPIELIRTARDDENPFSRGGI